MLILRFFLCVYIYTYLCMFVSICVCVCVCVCVCDSCFIQLWFKFINNFFPLFEVVFSRWFGILALF